MDASAWGIADSIMKSHPPARKELLTTSIQRALQHLLKPIHLEGLLQRRPVAIGFSQLAIARRKDERRATGNEGIGNWGDGLAVEMGVEDRKVEVDVLRRFQRLVDARGFGGDGVAEFAEHVLNNAKDLFVEATSPTIQGRLAADPKKAHPRISTTSGMPNAMVAHISSRGHGTSA